MIRTRRQAYGTGAERRWKSRWYPGDPHQIGRARRDLAHDLSHVSAAGTETEEALKLCLSEMFTNALVRASREGRGLVVFRSLSVRRDGLYRRVLRLSVGERESPEGRAVAALADHHGGIDGPGLTLIDHFAARWGSRRIRLEGGEWGYLMWAEFDVGESPDLEEAA